MEIQPTLVDRLEARRDPKPKRIPLMEQQWRHLLFLHWEYNPEVIQRSLPPGLKVDTFQGKAYIGIVPFWVSQLNLKFMPPIPGLSNFFELNLRTYVYDEKGRPGVWFYSLDANHYLAVQAAKAFFHLPYRYAQIFSLLNAEQQIEFNCHPYQSKINLNYCYQGKNPFQTAEENSLEFFLTERYYLFATTPQGLSLGQIHHTPYLLCQPSVHKWDDRLFELNGFSRPQCAPDHMLYSPGVDVEIFKLQSAEAKI